MNKKIRKILSVTLKGFFVVIVILVLVSSSFLWWLRTDKGSKWLGAKVSHILADEIGSEVSISKIKFTWLYKLDLEEVKINDYKGNEMISFRLAKVNSIRFNITNGNVYLGRVSVEGLKFNLVHYKNAPYSNMEYFIDKLDGESTSGGGGSLVTLGSVKVNKAYFKWDNEDKSYSEVGIDWDHILIDTLNVHANNFVIGKNLSGDIINLSLNDKSGFKIHKLKGDILFSDTAIIANGFELKTPNSDINSQFYLRYSNLDAFQYFIDSVDIKGTFLNSKVSFRDINYFAVDALKNQKDAVQIMQGSFQGRVNNLTVEQFEGSFGNYSYINGSVKIKGIPDVDNMFIRANLINTTSEYNDLMTLLPETELPIFLSKLGKVKVTGKFTGFINDFVSDGIAQTDLGNLETDIQLQLSNNDINNIYKGDISLQDFDLGTLVSEPKLGKVTLNGSIKGFGFKGENVSADVALNINSLDYANYEYKDITSNGVLKKGSFEGGLISNDTNAQLSFNGLVSFVGTPHIKGIADIKNLNLHALHFNKDTVIISTFAYLDFSANNLNDIQGNVSLIHTGVVSGSTLFTSDSISFSANRTQNKNSLIIHSDFLNANLSGNYKNENILDIFLQSVGNYIHSSIIPHSDRKKIDEFIVADISYNQIEPLVKILNLPFNLPGEGNVHLYLNAMNGQMDIVSNIQKLGFGKYGLSNIKTDLRGNKNSISGKIWIDNLKDKDSILIKNIYLEPFVISDSIFLLSNMASADSSQYLNATTSWKIENRKIIGSTQNVILSLNNKQWDIKGNNLTFENLDSLITIPVLSLHSGDEVIRASGKISKNSSPDDDPVRIAVENLNISSLAFLSDELNDFAGQINGNINIRDIAHKPIIESSVYISPLVYLGDTLGMITAITNYNQEDEKLIIDGSLKDYLSEEIALVGVGNINFKNEQSLSFNLSLKNTPLAILSPLTKGIASDLKGTATANLFLNGTIRKPNIRGIVNLDQASFKVDYLNTVYNFSHRFNFADKKIEFDKLNLYDSKGKIALVNGLVDLSDVSNPYFRVNLDAENFQLMNTTQKDNELFFGNAYGSGRVSIEGTPSFVDMKIRMKTEKGTVFNMPLGNTYSYNGYDYIEFTDKTKNSGNKKVVASSKESKLKMQFDLKITEDAFAKIIFDPLVGDVIEGRGSGDIKMLISTEGDFNIYGVYTIKEGSYRITLYDVISKKFNIAPGSTVTWLGDPIDAILNVTAENKIRTSLAPLVQSTSTDVGTTSSDNRIVPVEANLKLTGLLMKPDIKMDFNLPTENSVAGGSSEAFNMINRIKADEQELNKQVVSLLVFNRFSPAFQGLGADDAVGSGVNSGLGGVVSQQLNYFLGQLSDKIQVGVDYRKGEGPSVNGAINLFNDKVEVIGNYDANTSRVSTYNAVASIRLKEDGSFRAKAHSRSNNNPLIQNENTNTVGVGIFYQKEFDRLFYPWKVNKKTPNN